jgi:hypothetical protein
MHVIRHQAIANFSAVPSGLFRSGLNPGLTSWAKLRRPYGTGGLQMEFSPPLKPDVFSIMSAVTPRNL